MTGLLFECFLDYNAHRWHCGGGGMLWRFMDVVKEDMKKVGVTKEDDEDREGRSSTMIIPEAWALGKRLFKCFSVFVSDILTLTTRVIQWKFSPSHLKPSVFYEAHRQRQACCAFHPQHFWNAEGEKHFFLPKSMSYPLPVPHLKTKVFSQHDFFFFDQLWTSICPRPLE